MAEANPRVLLLLLLLLLPLPPPLAGALQTCSSLPGRPAAADTPVLSDLIISWLTLSRHKTSSRRIKFYAPAYRTAALLDLDLLAVCPKGMYDNSYTLYPGLSANSRAY